jgi:hypothetical protein
MTMCVSGEVRETVEKVVAFSELYIDNLQRDCIVMV